MKIGDMKTARQVHEENYRNDLEYRAEWDKTAFAESVAKSIAEYRHHCRLTQAELAEKVGMPQSVIARLERAKQPPSLQTLARLTAGTGLVFDFHVARGHVEFAEV